MIKYYSLTKTGIVRTKDKFNNSQDGIIGIKKMLNQSFFALYLSFSVEISCNSQMGTAIEYLFQKPWFQPYIEEISLIENCRLDEFKLSPIQKIDSF
jgi:hypothetical protein